MSVGNRRIDSEHKKIFEVIHRLQHSIVAKDCAAIVADFKLLEEFARDGFSMEEKIARKVGFDFTQHDLAHRNLLKKYHQLGDELAARKGFWSDSEGEVYKNFINDWMMKHLEYESEPLRIVLNTYLYDLECT